MYLPALELAMDGAVWGVAEEYGDAGVERCRTFMPVPGPLQSVQRAEFWVPLWLCSRSSRGRYGV